MQPRRMHPMKIIFSFIHTLRNSFVIILYLFIINFNDASTFIKIARYVFLAFLLYRLVALAIDWWKTTYGIQDGAIHIYRGWFKRTDNRVPIERVQNVEWHTPFYYRMFHLTSLSLQTSATEKEASVKFEAVKLTVAEQIEQLVLHKQEALKKQQDIPEDDTESINNQTEQTEMATTNSNTPDARQVHFQPTRRELWKASFLSFSFLAFIPILAAGYHEIDEVVDVDEQAKGFFTFLTSSWVIMLCVIILFAMFAIAFGIIRTFLKYGQYEIASDQERIYIRSGTLSRRMFVIRKNNVQAIQITQNPLKKLLGLLEINLLSAGSEEEESEEVHSLYPFLPQGRAEELLEELLPDFQMKEEAAMNKLPRSALLIRLLRVPWVWIIATILIVWFKPTWWWISPAIFLLTYISRVFDYRNTRFLLDGEFIQLKTGGLWSTVFVTNRKKVIEAEVVCTIVQQRFGLATIQTINRTKPVHAEELKDVPLETAHTFIKWYQERYKEIKVE